MTLPRTRCASAPISLSALLIWMGACSSPACIYKSRSASIPSRAEGSASTCHQIPLRPARVTIGRRFRAQRPLHDRRVSINTNNRDLNSQLSKTISRLSEKNSQLFLPISRTPMSHTPDTAGIFGSNVRSFEPARAIMRTMLPQEPDCGLGNFAQVRGDRLPNRAIFAPQERAS